MVFDVGEAEVFFAAGEFEEFAEGFGGAEGLGLLGVDGAEGKFDAEAARGVFVGLFEAEDAAEASGETSGEGAESEGGGDAFGGGEPAIGEGCFLRGVTGAALPFASGVEELFFVAFEAEEGGGGGLVRGGGVGACGEVFEAEGRGDFGVEAGGEGFGGGEGVFAGGGGVFHDAEEEGPGEDAAAMEAGGAGIGEAGALSGGDDAAAFVETATASATEHLEEFIRGEAVFAAAIVEGGGGDVDRADGEIDASGEAHGGSDDAELAGFGEGFDDAGAGGVGEAAVVVGDAVFEELGEFFAADGALFRGELEWVAGGEFGGEFAGDGFGFFAAGGEDEEGGEVGEEDGGGELGPVAFEVAGHALGEGNVGDVFEGNRAVFGDHDLGGAAEVAEPGGDVLGVGNGAAEQEESGVGWSEGDGAFVVAAARGVGDHLVFVDDQDGGAFTSNEALDLGFEGGDEDGGVNVFREITGGDADIPFGVFPLGVFVIGEGAGGDGIDGLAFEFEVAGLMEEFEDVGFAGTGRSADDDIGAGAEVVDGLMLPEIGEFEMVERGEHEPSVREASY